ELRDIEMGSRRRRDRDGLDPAEEFPVIGNRLDAEFVRDRSGPLRVRVANADQMSLFDRLVFLRVKAAEVAHAHDRAFDLGHSVLSAGRAQIASPRDPATDALTKSVKYFTSSFEGHSASILASAFSI